MSDPNDYVQPLMYSVPIDKDAKTAFAPILHNLTREAWRYHFAGQAMAAIIAKVSAIEVRTDGDRALCKQIAEGARLYADELMTELERTAKP